MREENWGEGKKSRCPSGRFCPPHPPSHLVRRFLLPFIVIRVSTISKGASAVSSRGRSDGLTASSPATSSDQTVIGQYLTRSDDQTC